MFLINHCNVHFNINKVILLCFIFINISRIVITIFLINHCNVHLNNYVVTKIIHISPLKVIFGNSEGKEVSKGQ